MKRQEKLVWGAALLTGILAFLTACVNPLGVAPEFKLSVDTTVTQGEEDWRIKITEAAVLMLVNRSKTIDVTKVIITQPENLEAADPVAAFENKPVRLTRKAQYLKPSDVDYQVQVFYDDYKSGAAVSGTPKTVTIPLPKAEEYSIYIYRSANGIVIIDKEPNVPADMEDTQDPPSQPPQSSDDGEGSSPAVVPVYNRDKMASFVVMNMTKKQAIDSVEFELRTGGGTKNHSISTTPQTVFGKTEDVPAVRPSDQQSIALGQGSWSTRINYTVILGPNQKEKRTAGVKQSIIIPASDPQSLRSNYLYFYQTKAGGFDIAYSWPPAAGDAAGDGSNVEIEDTLPAGWGILEITNKSQTGTVVEKVRLDTTDHLVNMAYDDMLRFPLQPGEVGVSFKPKARPLFGFVLPRTIVEGKVTKLSYVDYLGNTEDLPPAQGYGVGMLKIINNSTGVATSATVLNLKNSQNIQAKFFDYTAFLPPATVQYKGTGNVLIMGDANFPVVAGPDFLVQIELQTAQGTVVVERRAELLDKIVEIVISESDLSATKRYGSKVVIANTTTTPATVIGLQVYNKNDSSKNAVYNLSLTSPAPSTTSLYVLSSTTLPILQGESYGAKVSVLGNGNVAQIDKDFAEGSDLWNSAPDNHVRTLTITQADIEGRTPPLVALFVPVQDMSGIPLTLISAIQVNNGVTQLVTPGILHLSNYANVTPLNASARPPLVPVTWTKVSGDAFSNVNLSVDGVLTVQSVPASGNNKVKVQAVIAGAQGTTTQRTDFRKEFEIELVFNNIIVSNPVLPGGITLSPFSAQAGQRMSLVVETQVAFNPSIPHINGVPITVDHLDWVLVDGVTPNAELVGSNFTGRVGKTKVRVQAILPGARNGGTTVSSNIISVDVTPLPPPSSFVMRFIHIGRTDTIKKVVAVPYDVSAWLHRDDTCRSDPRVISTPVLPHLSGYLKAGLTGHSGENWPWLTRNEDAKDVNVINHYRNLGIPIQEFEVNIKELGLANLTLDWPQDPNYGYLLFFLEADHWARGYVEDLARPDNVDPNTAEANKLFFIHPQTLLDNNLVVWMGYTSGPDKFKHVPQGTPGAELVIPVCYDDWHNTASIMKSAGEGQNMIHDADIKIMRIGDNYERDIRGVW